MTVTAYYPEVFVKDLEAALAEFESIGFKLIQTVENEIIKMHIIEVNGNRLGIYTSALPEFRMEEGIYGMRVDVTDFEEGLGFYKNRGYEIIMEPKTEGSDLVAILEKDNEYHVSLHGPFNKLTDSK